MNKIIVYITIFLFSATTTVFGQNKKNVNKISIAPTEQEAQTDKLFTNMLPATAKVMFIDSIVVDKDSFIYKIPLNKESGYIYTVTENNSNINGYINEFRNRCYYSQKDSIKKKSIYTKDFLGGEWGEATKLEGIDDEYEEQDYPFLMSDGITLFFSAKGKNSLGGYDIFTTMFNSETGKFYQPENYGLPFNSTANDYLLAIDDLDSIGWLVSDRYQPEGKVCIYTFVPTNPRKSFEGDNISEMELKQYAKIQGIEKTWQFGNKTEAMKRLNKMKLRALNENNENIIYFIVNDSVTYRNINEFKSASSRKLYLEMKGTIASLEKKDKELSELREIYHRADEKKRMEMRQRILRAENEIDSLKLLVKQMNKKIRNTEITLLNK